MPSPELPEIRERRLAVRVTNSNSAADADNASEFGAGGGSGTPDTAVGYIQSGAYLFVATGPSESDVTSFMQASPTLSDGCVDNNVEFV